MNKKAKEFSDKVFELAREYDIPFVFAAIGDTNITTSQRGTPIEIAAIAFYAQANIARTLSENTTDVTIGQSIEDA